MDFKVLLVVLLFATGYECSRILVLFPTISKSHIIPLQTLAVELARKGHDITFMSTYPLGKKIENYRDIKIPFDEADKEFLSEIARDPSGKGFTYMFPKLTSLIYRLGNDTLQSKDMKKLMEEEQFDLVIVGFFLTEFMLGVADHFKCPSILFSPAGTMSIINQALGNPLGVSGTPSMVAPVPKMDFLGRLKTFIVTSVELGLGIYIKHRGRQVYDFNFPSERYRSYDESLRNVSLALVNYHFSSGVVRPYVPGIVEVGGIQVKPKPDPLPENLKNFLDGAKDGAIFFSLGSNAKSTFLAKETINIILKVFSELKQKVVMKWESDSMEGQPENVFISKWLPQDDILAHPNMKLFISHCGLGGIVEAKYHGVPIVGFPLFGDQPGNAANIVKEGWAVQVDLGALSEKSFKDAILEVLKNPKYTETVKKMATLARDRPQNAQDTAVFWVEYVLRHRGAPHMHYPGADLNFWQFNSIDVILFLVAVIYMVFKTLKFAVKKICCGASDTRKEKLN